MNILSYYTKSFYKDFGLVHTGVLAITLVIGVFTSSQAFAAGCDYKVDDGDSQTLKDLIMDPNNHDKVICLRQGVYSPGNNPEDTFEVKALNLTLKGVSPEKTILSGGGVNNHVMMVMEDGSGLKLEKLTIEGGHAEYDSTPLIPPVPGDLQEPYGHGFGFTDKGQGAGIYILNADVSLNKVHVLNNVIEAGDAELETAGATILTGGAGLFARGGNLTIDHSVFADNSAINGAGLNMIGSNVSTRYFDYVLDVIQLDRGMLGNITINNTLFYNNHAVTSGGGFNIAALDSATLNNVKVIHNTANKGFSGGGLILNTFETIVDKSLFKKNDGARYGGLVVEGRSESITDQPDLTTLVISNTKFIENRALGSDQAYPFGGGLATQSKFFNESGRIITVDAKNLLFENNSGTVQAGGWHIQKAVVKMKNINFKNNNAPYGAGATIGWNSLVEEMKNVSFVQNMTSPLPEIYRDPLDEIIQEGLLSDGGGFEVIHGSRIELMENVRLFNNVSTDGVGGGIFIGFDFVFNGQSGNAGDVPSSIGEMKNVLFKGNIAATPNGGNAIYCSMENPNGPPVQREIGPLNNVHFIGADQDVVGCDILQ